MNYYVRYFDDETLVHTMDEVLAFLSEIDEIEVTPAMERELYEYADSDVFFPKRYKVRSRVYFIIIKTEAETMLDFKQKKAVRSIVDEGERPVAVPVVAKLNEECFGWYEGALDFKRVVLSPSTGKHEYRDTHFVAQVKAESGLDCYNRIVESLRSRVDSRSQFPSAKGKSFKFRYLGRCK